MIIYRTAQVASRDKALEETSGVAEGAATSRPRTCVWIGTVR
jgi:hypothetical protein